MYPLRIYTLGAVVAIVCIALLFAPALGLPVGASPSTGGSMGDDGIVLNIYGPGEPAVGDVVIYEGGPSHDYAAHRVIDSSMEGYITQGDANNFVDQDVAGVDPVTKETLVGVVVVRVPLQNVVGASAVLPVAYFLATRKNNEANYMLSYFSGVLKSVSKMILSLGSWII